MKQCPFCLASVRQVGGVMLITPDQLTGKDMSNPLTGECCVDCMGLLAMILDGLRNGRIRALVEKLELAGAIRQN